MFYPFQEIYVKTEGEVLTVSAKQETRGSRREFQQMFTIPAGVKVDKLSSALSKAGVLTISAPRDPLYLATSAADTARDNEVAAITDQVEKQLSRKLIWPSLSESKQITVKEDELGQYSGIKVIIFVMQRISK